MSSMLVLLCGLAVIFGLFASYQRYGRVKRRRRFDDRKLLAEDTWFDTFYPVDHSIRARVREVLDALAQEIGVNWTQFRPEDTFETHFRVPSKYSPIDDLDGAELEIVDLLPELQGLRRSTLKFSGTLQSFLDDVVGICKGGVHASGEPSPKRQEVN